MSFVLQEYDFRGILLSFVCLHCRFGGWMKGEVREAEGEANIVRFVVLLPPIRGKWEWLNVPIVVRGKAFRRTMLSFDSFPFPPCRCCLSGFLFEAQTTNDDVDPPP